MPGLSKIVCRLPDKELLRCCLSLYIVVKSYRLTVLMVFFPVSPDECKERDKTKNESAQPKTGWALLTF